ncbi:MAG: class I SAM-dependent DNA methyltransferase, partial [Chloroflexi bacterium]
PREHLRQAIAGLQRYIATPSVAKHRVFVWLYSKTRFFPNDQLIVFARDDDYFFGVLHSKIHEVWALRLGGWLGKGNDARYTHTTVFEPFPLPWPPGQEDTQSEQYQAIAVAAKQLHEERQAWLDGQVGFREGMDVTRSRKDRTLTNLYNALAAYRGKKKVKVKAVAGDFAPRLDELHRVLDAAVCHAYGWEIDILDDEEAILSRLLALNLQRAQKSIE